MKKGDVFITTEKRRHQSQNWKRKQSC